MGRFKKLVESEEAMEKFVADYKIPDNVGLRYCKEGDWHIMRREGEVVIPIIAFLEGGIRLPMRPVVRDYLRHFRLAPIGEQDSTGYSVISNEFLHRLFRLN